MIRIIHAADLHLDSPFESLDAEKASVRRSEQRALLERIAAEVNQRNANLLFLAGDLLDSGSAYAETGEALLAALGKLTAEYGRIGSNLNQIARAINDWHNPYPQLAAEVRAAASNLAALKFEVLEKVGEAVGNVQTYQL